MYLGIGITVLIFMITDEWDKSTRFERFGHVFFSLLWLPIFIIFILGELIVDNGGLRYLTKTYMHTLMNFKRRW